MENKQVQIKNKMLILVVWITRKKYKGNRRFFYTDVATWSFRIFEGYLELMILEARTCP